MSSMLSFLIIFEIWITIKGTQTSKLIWSEKTFQMLMKWKRRKMYFSVGSVLKDIIFHKSRWFNKAWVWEELLCDEHDIVFILFEEERTKIPVPWNLHHLCFILEKIQTTGLDKYRNNMDFNGKIISLKIIKEKPKKYLILF